MEIGINTALFLISSGGREWLSRTDQMFETLDPKAAVWPAQIERLRRDLMLDPAYQNAVLETNNTTGRLDVGEVAGSLIELAWLRQRHTRYLTAKDERRLKFSDLAPAHLFVTRTAYEQASNSVVAAHRARRYASHCRRSLVRQIQLRLRVPQTAGLLQWQLSDMGCGCGADTLAMAQALARIDRAALLKKAEVPPQTTLPEFRISVTALDSDPGRLILAAANLASIQHRVSVSLDDPAATERANAALRKFVTPMATGPLIVFEQGDLTTGTIEQRLDASMYDAIFLDPGRRTSSGERIFHIDAYQPPLGPFIDRWFDAQQTASGRTIDAGLGIKLSPGISYDEIERFAPGDLSELEFISQRGALKEAVLWFGPLRTHTQATPPKPVRVRATILTGSNEAPTAMVGTTQTVDESNLDIVQPPQSGDYLLEPDPAIIRAHLVVDLAHSLHALRVDPSIAYLILPRAAIAQATSIVPCARPYHVESVIYPFSLKALRAAMQGRAVERGQVVVKKRGSPIDPQKIIQSLKLPAKIVQDEDDNRPAALTEAPDNATIIVLTRFAGKPIAFITRPALPAS